MHGIDFFDVDHTVTRHSSARHFLVLGFNRGIFPLTSLLSVPFYFIQYRYGSGLRLSSREIPVLRGKTREFLVELSNTSFETLMEKDIFPDALNLIRSQKDGGRRVVLATSSLDIIVQPLADYLGVEDLIATSLEYTGGVCTGRFQGNPIFGYEKMRRVIDFIQASGESRRDCSFYSDSIHDLPLLEVIGQPVAVNPDARLKRVAQKKGWKTMRFR